MKNKTMARLIYVFMGAMLIIGLVLLFLPRVENEISESENRLLAAKPRLNASDVLSGKYENSLEDYLSDHFPARDAAIEVSRLAYDSVSLASWEDYALIIEDPENDMQPSAETEPEPAFEPEPTEVPVYTAPEATPEPTQIPVPVETSASQNAFVRAHKPAADVNSFPSTLGIRVYYNGTSKLYNGNERRTVQQMSAIFDKYASALPEDGTFIMTVVPTSSRVTQFLAQKKPERMTSDTESFVYAVTGDKVETVSSSDVLSARAVAGEYMFFTTDMHWTPEGAYYVVKEMLSKCGKSMQDYSEFNIQKEYPFLGTLYRDNPTKQMKNNPDTLDIISPKQNYTVKRYTSKTQFTEIPLIKENAKSNDRFTVYLGGSAGPWTVIETGADNDETCMVICDSYGLCTIPMFMTEYGRVCYYDPRYYDAGKMGQVSGLMKEYSVKDVYLIAATVHSFDGDKGDFYNRMNKQF